MIRRAEPADAGLVKGLRLAALTGAPGAFGSTFERESAFEDQVWVDRLHPDAHPTFVWEDDEGAHAMAVGVIDPDDANVVWLNAMWVQPARRGRGIGEAIVGAVCEWARAAGARAVRLEVAEGNDRAEALYRRCGFSRTGRAELRSRDSIAEHHMERVLR